MYEITGTTIRLTRGDTFKTVVGMKWKGTGEDYTPVEGDVVRFALKRSVYDHGEPIIEKTIPHDTMLLQLQPSDTKQLSFGSYVYDIEITFANGDVDTFIQEAKFELLPEVD